MDPVFIIEKFNSFSWFKDIYDFFELLSYLIETVAGFVFAWRLLTKRTQNVLPLIAVITAGTAVKYLFCTKVNFFGGVIISAAVLLAGSLLLFREKPGKTAAVSLTATYISCISDLILGCFTAAAFGKSLHNLRFEYIFIKMLSIAFFIIVYHILQKIPNNSPSKFYSFLAGVMAGFGTVTSIFADVFGGEATDSSFDNLIAAAIIFMIFFAAGVTVIGFFAELCITLDREQKLVILETNYKYFSEQIDIRKENERAFKKFRHDILNYLSDIRGLISMNQTDSAMKLLEETSGKAEQINSYLIDTGNIFVDVVIASKLAVCGAKKIEFEYKTVDMNNCKLEAADISSLLSNMLDNAIEASEKTKKPYVKLDIFEYNTYLVFRVENNILEEISISDNGKLRTTKKDNSVHGYGTEIICEIAQKYNGDFSWKTDNTCFSATVFIKE